MSSHGRQQKGKAPAFQFYTGDWRKDPLLQSCTLAARGLWIDLLCAMWDSPERGYLVRQDGQPLTEGEIARMVGETPGNVRRAMEELERAGVYSTDEHGAIYSRRMVRDEAKRAGTRTRVRKHREKNACNADCNADCNGAGNADVTAMKQRSSSSSSSSTSVPPNTPPPPGSFLEWWNAYPPHRRKNQGACITAWQEALETGAEPAALIAAASEYAASPVGSGQYAVAAARWLTDRCWLDDRAAWRDVDGDGRPKRDYDAIRKAAGGAA